MRTAHTPYDYSNIPISTDTWSDEVVLRLLSYAHTTCAVVFLAELFIINSLYRLNPTIRGFLTISILASLVLAFSFTQQWRTMQSHYVPINPSRA